MVTVLVKNMRKWSKSRYVTDIPAVEVGGAELTALGHKQAVTSLVQLLATGWTLKKGSLGWRLGCEPFNGSNHQPQRI